ncbi:hypothetical protein TNCT_735441 [Trichonephila clavata]|uniref:Uncharacterized protein n=1 Tax=Trichonephila clavata TaxID=2740835 RepID=A0A8X6HIR6_TRICU|nr:hypothetical protein TNCT_735441 [Trichonephila clavata]
MKLIKIETRRWYQALHYDLDPSAITISRAQSRVTTALRARIENHTAAYGFSISTNVNCFDQLSLKRHFRLKITINASAIVIRVLAYIHFAQKGIDL